MITNDSYITEIYELSLFFDRLENNQAYNLDCDDSDTTIFDGEIFLNRLKYYYAKRLFQAEYDESLTLTQNINNACDKFYNLYRDYIDTNYYNFYKLWIGLNSDYDLVENYNRIEEGAILDNLHKGSKTTTTPKQNNTEITETNETNYIVGENSTNDTKTDKTTSSVYTTESRFEDIDSNTFDYNEHTFNNYRVHGNIGVSTGADMLEKELNLRTKNFIFSIIDNFIKSTTFYCEVAKWK